MRDIPLNFEGKAIVDENNNPILDLSNEETRDLNLTGDHTTDIPTLKQIIEWRLKTRRGDAYHAEDYGADLNEFVGLTLNLENLELLKGRVYEEILKDNLVSADRLEVFTIPISEKDIIIVISIDLPEYVKPIQFSIPFSFEMGFRS